jgi:uncharacterized membrane protein YfcA
MTSPFLLLAVGFAVALVTAPAGVSGAFLLLPLQVSVFGIPTSAATATNLVYNVIATPGGIERYRRDDRLDLPLASVVLLGSVPGVVVGAVLRVTVFGSPATFKVFVGVVLLALAAKLLLEAASLFQPRRRKHPVGKPAIVSIAFAIGIVGGIYGIGGGSILAPYLVAVAAMPLRRVAGAALLATLVTSAVGLVALIAFGLGPDWPVGLFLGVGGLAGSFAGAAMQRRFAENSLRVFVGVLAGALGLSYIASATRR